MWYWQFRNASNVYTTCWDANITTASGDITQNSVPTVEPTETPTQDSSFTYTTVYTVKIPICYTGAAFNETLVMSAFETLLSDSDYSSDEIEFTLTAYMENSIGDQFNATIETNHLESELEDIVSNWAYDGNVCDEIESNYNNIGSCTTCGGASVTSYIVIEENTGSNNSSNNGSNLAILVGIIIVAVLLVVFIALMIYKIRLDTHNQGGNVESGMAAAMATNGNKKQK